MSATATVALVEATVMFSPASAVLTADQLEFPLAVRFQDAFGWR